jgi:hypothetical protein
MVSRSSWRFSHPPNLSLVKCFKPPIVVGSDSIDLQSDKFNIDNEEMLPMVSGSSLRFSHPYNNNWIKCFKSSIVVGNDSIDLS